jgi:hypothetical protein
MDLATDLAKLSKLPYILSNSYASSKAFKALICDENKLQWSVLKHITATISPVAWMFQFVLRFDWLCVLQLIGMAASSQNITFSSFLIFSKHYFDNF